MGDVTMVKATVSVRAVLLRVNRQMAKEGKQVRRAAGGPNRSNGADLGDFYMVDLEAGEVVKRHLDLAAVAEKLGVMQPWEQVEGEA